MSPGRWRTDRSRCSAFRWAAWRAAETLYSGQRDGELPTHDFGETIVDGEGGEYSPDVLDACGGAWVRALVWVPDHAIAAAIPRLVASSRPKALRSLQGGGSEA